MERSSVDTKTLEIALRVVEAYSEHTPPIPADEAYLRELASDTTTPGDDLACEIVQAELQEIRSQKKGVAQARYRKAV